MNKTLLSLGVMCLAGISSLLAGTLTPEQALRRALSDSRARVGAAMPANGYQLAYTAPSETSVPALYVFNNQSAPGFVVVSADDRFAPLLGMSLQGSFDIDRAPSNLLWWLQEYRNEISAAMAAPSPMPRLIPENESENEDFPVIEPLMATQWNQGAPYNDLCPSDGGGKCVTGCVATAMAQVMRYHSWPSQGIGEISYQTGNGIDVGCDFSSVTFDWDNMIDNYDARQYTPEEASAVANLMFAAGASVKMGYTSYESGAYSENITNGLVTYLGYDSKASLVKRNLYGYEAWKELVYSEIAARRPVVYGGSSDAGGHQFVCDGYSGNGYFHINWGWGGYYDGNFLLSALDPSGQGIGGSGSNYNSGQSAVIAVGRPGEVDRDAIVPLFGNEGFFLEEMSGDVLTFGLGFAVFNYSGFELNGYMGVKIVGAGGEADYVEGPSIMFTPVTDDGRVSGIGSYSLYAPLDGYASGRYVLTPAFKMDGEDKWYDIKVEATYPQSVIMEVGEDGSRTFSRGMAAALPTLKVTSMSFSEQRLLPSMHVNMYMDLENGEEEYEGVVSLLCKRKDTSDEPFVQPFYSRVAPGGSGTYYIGVDMPATDGVYDFWFVDYDSNVISQTFTYTVGETGQVVPESVTLTPESVSLIVGESATLNVTVTPENAETTLTWTSGNPQVVAVSDAGAVSALAPGETVVWVTTDNDLTAYCTVKVSQVNVTEITLEPAAIEGYVGDSIQLTATIYPDNATVRTLFWYCDYPDIATVDDNGLVTLTGIGEAEVTATAADGSGVFATCTVTVNPVPAAYVEVSPSYADGHRGDFVQLAATVYPENTTDKTVTWSSDSPEVAVVDANGLVEMLTPGEAVVTATVGDVVGECRITVNPVFVEQILLTPEFVEAVEGTEITLVAEVIPIDADNTTLEWSSDNEAVATVSQEGVVNILAPGEAIVTAAATDGSLVKGQSVVTGISGVGLISGDGCEWKLYDLDGRVLRKNVKQDDLKTLLPGVYILRSDSRVVKINIR